MVARLFTLALPDSHPIGGSGKTHFCPQVQVNVVPGLEFATLKTMEHIGQVKSLLIVPSSSAPLCRLSTTEARKKMSLRGLGLQEPFPDFLKKRSDDAQELRDLNEIPKPNPTAKTGQEQLVLFTRLTHLAFPRSFW